MSTNQFSRHNSANYNYTLPNTAEIEGTNAAQDDQLQNNEQHRRRHRRRESGSTYRVQVQPRNNCTPQEMDTIKTEVTNLLLKQNQINKRLETLHALAIDAARLAVSYKNSRSSIRTALHKAAGAVSLKLQSCIKGAWGNVKTIEKYIKMNKDLVNKSNQIARDLEKQELIRQHILNMLEDKISVQQAAILADLILRTAEKKPDLRIQAEDKIALQTFGVEGLHVPTSTAQEMQELQPANFYDQTPMELVHALQEQSAYLDAKIAELTQIHETMQNCSTRLLAEIKVLNDSNITLSAALTSGILITAGSLAGAIFVPIPALGVLTGSAVGSTVSYISNRINSNCSVM